MQVEHDVDVFTSPNQAIIVLKVERMIDDMLDFHEAPITVRRRIEGDDFIAGDAELCDGLPGTNPFGIFDSVLRSLVSILDGCENR